jgi:signal transduction histidine kinase
MPTTTKPTSKHRAMAGRPHWISGPILSMAGLATIALSSVARRDPPPLTDRPSRHVASPLQETPGTPDRFSGDEPSAAPGLNSAQALEEDTDVRLHSSFLANVRQEFRTPLCALNASVEYMLEELDRLTKDEIGLLLRSIHLSVTGLQTLIDNLMESTNIEAGSFFIRPVSIRLDEVVLRAVRIIQPLIDRRRQSLTFELATDLPKVQGDPTRLTQVLVNLLSNASKFGPISQDITVRALPLGDQWVHVSIEDRGPGIPPAEHDRLFRRFVHPMSADDALLGMGLGLSVVKAIVEEHGGEVGVSERPGGGSIFWFTIPTVGQQMGG